MPPEKSRAEREGFRLCGDPDPLSLVVQLATGNARPLVATAGATPRTPARGVNGRGRPQHERVGRR